MRELHSHNILHRDLKPANILLDDKDICRIADFGFAIKLQDGDANNQMQKSYVGSPFYMSP